MVVVGGNAGPRVSEDGILQVGVIPFLLDPAILDTALADAPYVLSTPSANQH